MKYKIYYEVITDDHITGKHIDVVSDVTSKEEALTTWLFNKMNYNRTSTEKGKYYKIKDVKEIKYGNN